MTNQKSARTLGIIFMLAGLFLFLKPLDAQLWRLSPDLSFSTSGAGWAPIDAAMFAGSYYGVRNGGYFKAGYGVSFDKDYYLLIPEQETAFHANAGFDMLSGASTGFTPGGAAETTGPYRDFRRLYLDLGLEQVLVGDRRHENSFLMLSLGDVSRFVMPAALTTETTAPEPFFRHSPWTRLSFNAGSRRPFWDVAGLSGGLGATLEAGHSASRGGWAFLMTSAELGFKLPILGKYLYLDAKASAGALAVNFLPAAVVPAWAYTDYADAATCEGGLDLKCRAIEYDPLLPMALELGVGIGAATKAAILTALDPLSAKPFIRAFTDLALESTPFGDMRIRVGATYDIEAKTFGFLFSTI